jgi:hypothetical protein
MTQELSITTFRYVPSNLRAKLRESEVELHLDALNRELVDRLQRGGETFISNAVVGGHYLLRACIVNFHTTQTDVEAVPDIVDERPDTWVTLKMLEARVGFEPPRSLSTRKLFNPRNAQNATIARIARVRYTAGTRRRVHSRVPVWHVGATILESPAPGSGYANESATSR